MRALPKTLSINQYGSNLHPQPLTQDALIELEVSNSISDLGYETSNAASRALSNSSSSDASTGVQNELPSSSPQNLNETLSNISNFFQGK